MCVETFSLSLSLSLSVSLSLFLSTLSLFDTLSASHGPGFLFTYTTTLCFQLFFFSLLVGFGFLVDSRFQMFKHRLEGARCGSAGRDH